MPKVQKKRRYSDEQRAATVAAVAANGGNVQKTAKQLGIPKKTIEHWVKQERHAEAAKNGQLKRGPLADQFLELAAKLVGIADAKADKLNAKDAVIAAGVAVDKARLLRGEPTQIDEHRGTVTARIDHLAAAFAGAADREEAKAEA